MRRGLLIALIGVMMPVGVARPAEAGPLEEGFAAWNRLDFASALRLLRPLAMAGDAEAQYLLGTMYGNGDGMARDSKLAYMWFSLAATQGYSAAAEGRSLMATTMTAAQIADAEQLVRDWKPSLIR